MPWLQLLGLAWPMLPERWRHRVGAATASSLPFHPLDSEGEHKPTKIKMAEWVVGKLARELGINATGGSSSIADL